ncbi:hypothetical protein [Devosia ginsengisoli]|uniref:Phage gp6-like head-tail connector protein n=1 Tax=Devosia ginsengisoli TaxID=400770 RepID=A0A5B8LS93_9HYPH|nr:hypothetical protein [Devosia ginsengisoli]QDZ10524.1 hypothetical protein FPZ08_07030 [Devosia ginsengisoli]
MSTIRISGPSPIVLPSELSGTYPDDDVAALAAIAAAQGRIDGPTGWVGRSFGVQVLDTLVTLQPGRWYRLPYPPVIEIVSVTGADGAEVSFEADPVELDRIKISGPSGQVRVRYRAGYELDEETDEGTGVVPAQVKQAVIVGAGRILAFDPQSVGLRSESVEGIGTDAYAAPDATEAAVDLVMSRLLSGLKVITP